MRRRERNSLCWWLRFMASNMRQKHLQIWMWASNGGNECDTFDMVTIFHCITPCIRLAMRAAMGHWKLFTTQKKSQNWRRAINSTPFSDFFGGVLGQKCICSYRFWEQNKNDPQRRCNFLHLVLNLEMTFQGIFHQKLVFAQHQITAVSNHFGTFYTLMKVCKC